MHDLKRTLGLPALLFFGVGVIVGAGIYSVIGAAAGEAGEGLWLSFVLAAVPAGLTALNYAELVAMMPRVGAEYTFLREAFPRRAWVPFGAGFLVVLTNATTAATVSLAFAGYLERLVDVPVWLGALGLLAAGTAVNVVGIRESAWVAALFTLVEVAGLGLLAAGTVVNVVGIRESAWVAALFTLVEVAGLGLVVWAGAASGRLGAGALAPVHAGVFSGAALIFFVYTGFEGIVNLAEEAKAPRRDLPRALLWSGGITLTLYLLVALAVLALAAPAALAASESPLSTALEGHPRLAAAIAVIALFSTANTALVTLVVASRMLLGMARAGDMPRALERIGPRRRSPVRAALVVFLAAAALVPVGKVALAGSVSSLSTLLSFTAVGAAVIALRLREPERERPFRVPWSVRGVPVPSALAILAAIALATQFRPAAFALAGSALAVGVALALTKRWWGRD